MVSAPARANLTGHLSNPKKQIRIKKQKERLEHKGRICPADNAPQGLFSMNKKASTTRKSVSIRTEIMN